MPDAAAVDRHAAMLDVAIVAERMRSVGLTILSAGVAASTLTFNWIVEHHPEANFFPEFAGTVLYLSDLLLICGIGVWFAAWYLFPRPALSGGPRAVVVPLAILMILTALSVGWASDAGLAAVSATRRMLLFAAYGVLVTDARRAQRPMMVALLVCGGLQAAVAGAQVLKGAPLGLRMLGELPGPSSGSGNIGCPRPVGLGFHSNPLALFLGVVVALAYGLLLLADAGSWKRWLMLVPLEAALLALACTQARAPMFGVWLSVVVVSLAAVYWNRGERAASLGRAAIVVALMAITLRLYPVVLPVSSGCNRGERYTEAPLTSMVEGRTQDFWLALPIIRSHVWLGVGAANYPLALKRRLSPDVVAVTPVHNVPLLLEAELGIAGAGAWLAIVGAPLVWLWSRRRAARLEPREMLWLGPLLVLFFVGGAEFSPWATEDGRVLMMAVLAMWAGSVAGPGELPRTSSKSPMADSVRC